jgi:hypothetical protein
VARIARWRRISLASAHRLFHASLVSEAQEEADTAFFMRQGEAFDRWLASASRAPTCEGATVLATLHLGTPVHGYLAFRRAAHLDVRAVGRGLGPTNPMAQAKLRYARRKVAWVYERAGVEFLEPDAVSMARAREHLLRGKLLYAAIDVPGDAVSRSAEVEMCGERLSYAAGVMILARLTKCTVLPLVAISRPDRIEIEYGDPIEPGRPDVLTAVFAELTKFIERYPDQWWLWPYVVPA